MNPLPWLPLITGVICAATLPIGWWAAIDRQRWLLVRAYRRHRPGIDARRHIEWADNLLEIEPYDWDDDEDYWDYEYEGDYDDYDPGTGRFLSPTIETRVAKPELL